MNTYTHIRHPRFNEVYAAQVESDGVRWTRILAAAPIGMWAAKDPASLRQAIEVAGESADGGLNLAETAAWLTEEIEDYEADARHDAAMERRIAAGPDVSPHR